MTTKLAAEEIVEGAIAEDAPPPSISRDGDDWRHQYDRSSFMFQSSYLPDDFTAAGSAAGDNDTAADDDKNENATKRKGLVARGTSKINTNKDENGGGGSHASSSGSTPRKINQQFIRNSNNNKQRRVVGFRDELSVYAEETASNFGDDSTWRGFRIVVPAPSSSSQEQKPGQGTAEHWDGLHSRAGLSTVTFESALLNILLPNSRKAQWVCIWVIVLLIAGSVTVAVTCGRGHCRSRDDHGDNIIAPPWPPDSFETTSAPATVDPNTPTAASTPPHQAFASTEELYAAVDAYLKAEYDPAFSEIAQRYGHPMGTWRVEQLTNFSFVFDVQRNRAVAFNFTVPDLNGWDTSRAITMRYMFRGAKNFNGDLNWNVQAVTDMQGMFENCTHLEGTTLANWQTGSVVSFREFLARATSFRGDLRGWNVTSATDMYGMFRLVGNFNSDVSRWQVGRVTDMSRMFLNCFAFEGEGLERWDTSRVQDMSLMFANAPSFNGDLSSWNVTSVRSMRGMFRESTSFNGDLSKWNTGNVVSFESMFRHAASFNSEVSGWKTQNVRTFNAIFFGAASFRSDISSWDVRSAIDISMAFVGTSNFESNLCAWGQRLPSSGNVLTTSMFIGSGCPNTNDPNPNNIVEGPFCGECAEKTTPTVPSNSSTDTNSSWSFGLTLATTGDLYDAVDQYLEDSSPTSDIAYLYGYPIGTWDVSRVISFESVFDVERNPAVAHFDEPLNGWETSQSTSMRRMFAGANKFNSLLGFNTSSVTDMSGMFEGADLFNQELGPPFDTANVVDMSSMFRSALSFEGMGLESWNVNKVVTMHSLFEEAISFSGSISGWETENVIDMARLFHHATSFTEDLSGWSVERVKVFDYAFRGARTWNRDISGWKISSAVSFISMFAGALNFNQDLCSFGIQLASSNKAEIDTRGMFVSTACPLENDPDPSNLANGPFCRSCSTLGRRLAAR